MILKYFLVALLHSVSGYNLLDAYVPSSLVKTFHYCKSESDTLREMTNQAISYINNYDIHYISLKGGFTEPVQNNINTICSVGNNQYGYYGYTKLFGTNETDIFVSQLLMNKPNTLYNVLLHELTHSLGCNHTNIPSVMNYTIMINERNEIINDRRKIYFSLDDIKCLRKIKRSLTCTSNNLTLP